MFQLLLSRCRQPNLSHLFQPPLIRHLTRGYLKKDAKSSDACIRVNSYLNWSSYPGWQEWRRILREHVQGEQTMHTSSRYLWVTWLSISLALVLSSCDTHAGKTAPPSTPVPQTPAPPRT